MADPNVHIDITTQQAAALLERYVAQHMATVADAARGFTVNNTHDGTWLACPNCPATVTLPESIPLADLLSTAMSHECPEAHSG